MIIWGSRVREKQVGTGTFHCVNCHVGCAYAHMEVARWFTLYFIPVFPTQTLGEYVRCLRCSGQFKTTVLTLTPEQVQALVTPWTCANCRNRNRPDDSHCVACGARQDYVPASARSPYAPPEHETPVAQPAP